MKRIGIQPGKSLDFEKLDPTVKEALEKAAVDGLREMEIRARRWLKPSTAGR